MVFNEDKMYKHIQIAANSGRNKDEDNLQIEVEH